MTTTTKELESPVIHPERRLAKELADALADMHLGVTVGKRGDESATLSVPATDYPLVALLEFLRYGHQRKFNDPVGSAEKFPTCESKVQHVEKMIEAFKNGVIGRVTAVGVDAFTIRARSIGRAKLKAKLGKESKEWKNFIGKTPEEQTAILDQLVVNNPQYLTQAKEEIEAKIRANTQSNVVLAGIDLS